MNVKIVTTVIVISLFFGILAGYWWRETREQNAAMAAITAPASIIKMGPPSTQPLPLTR